MAKKRPIKLGGRRTPIRVKKKKAPKLDTMEEPPTSISRKSAQNLISTRIGRRNIKIRARKPRSSKKRDPFVARQARITKRLNIASGAAKRTKVAQNLKKLGTEGITMTVVKPDGISKIDPLGRTIDIGIKIGAETQVVSVPQSVRGSFAAGTERLIDSVIIHLIIYEPETSKLYIQLTGAGEWRDYTYFKVSFRKFESFRDAPSKGRFFNRNIRNTQKWGFKHNFVRGKQL